MTWAGVPDRRQDERATIYTCPCSSLGLCAEHAAQDAAASPVPDQQREAVARLATLADQFDADAEVREVRAATYPPSGPWALEHNRLAVRADTFRRCASRIRDAIGPELLAALAAVRGAEGGDRR